MSIKLYSNLKDQIPYLLHQQFKSENFITVASDKLIVCLKYLKNHIGLQYNLLSCISGVDLLQEKYRFSIAYDLLSLVFNSLLRLKIFIDEYIFVPSTIEVYINANWCELELLRLNIFVTSIKNYKINNYI